MSEEHEICARCSEAQPDLIAGYDGRAFCGDCCAMAGGASMPAYLRGRDRIVLRRLGRPRWKIAIGAVICVALIVIGIELGARALDSASLLVGAVAGATLIAAFWVGFRVSRRDAEFDGWSLTFDRREHPGRIHLVQRTRTGKVAIEAWGDFARLVEWLDKRSDHLEDQQRESRDLARGVALAFLHTPGDTGDADGVAAPFPARARASDAFRQRGS